MRDFIVASKLTELDCVLDFVDKFLKEYNCPPDLLIKIAIAVEEIYSNIAHYAYASQEGKVQIRCRAEDSFKTAVIEFIDYGYPYNPLEKEEPDITLSAQERSAGGLGIYMVKKSMDEVKYEYKDNKNILTIKKKIKN